MNRVIKFRAWDNKYKVMLCAGFNIVGEVTLFSGVESMLSEQSKLHNDDTPSLLRLNDLIIMQYTGLSDSNGKEIYEGDIVKWTSWKKDKPPYNNVVEFFAGGQSCGFRIRNKSFMKPLTGNGILNAKAEIIGNKFETSELL